MPELKPCPFCGGTDLKIHTAFGVQGNFICASCQAEGPLAVVESADDVLFDLAVEAWNRRTVRHGHILKNDDGAFTCSVCGERYIMRANYCPNCAARLDGPVSYVAGTYLDWDNGRYCPGFGKDDRELQEEYEKEIELIWKKQELT
ncbi:MAG: Lar family restriction alleviation protein [Oscillibacter sp.]|nr:Lar family restriction alleviation protein [Oscillibacter sp.]